jgi:predicted metal-dependent HD superfamily phosphohydrolase
MAADERELHVAWRCHVGSGHDAERWFDDIVTWHRAPDRHYHGVRHVRWVVDHVRRLADERTLTTGQIDRLVAAAFFHDVVHDTRRDDNEGASAAVARRALTELGWPDDAIEEVAAMIAATAEHGPVDDETTAVLLAADLGVLAADPAGYGDYVRGVRREYAHLDDAAWTAGRTAFVRSTLARDHIFPALLALDGWERRARANLTAELAASVSGGRDGSDAREP